MHKLTPADDGMYDWELNTTSDVTLYERMSECLVVQKYAGRGVQFIPVEAYVVSFNGDTPEMNAWKAVPAALRNVLYRFYNKYLLIILKYINGS